MSKRMKIARLYQDGHEIYGDKYDITLADANNRHGEQIAGPMGWVDAYIVETKPGFARLRTLVARVPAYKVTAEYEDAP